MRKDRRYAKKERIIVFSTALILLAVFTFTDLQISTLLFTKNLYGRTFEVIGELPFVFLSLFGCCLLIRFRSRKNLVINISSAALLSVFVLLFTFMGGFMTWNYLCDNVGKISIVWAVLLGGLLLAGAIIFAAKIPKESAHKAITYGIIALVYFVLVLIVMNSLKATWGRMRLREMTDPIMQFTPWYVITSRGGFNNIYASFPSGHSMNSAAVILSLLLPSFVPALAKKGKLLKVISYTWLVLVGISRVVMGAHFSSDVVMGIMLSLALFELTRTVISKLRKENLLEAYIQCI